MTYALRIALIAAAVFSASTAAHAQSVEEAARIIAEESAAYFGGLCVATRGQPDAINATIEAQQLKGQQLSDEGVAKMLEGQPGDQGWLVMTNRDVGVKLHVKQNHICQIETVDLDDDALQETIASVLATLSERERFTYKKMVDESRETNGGVQHLVGYQLVWSKGGVAGKVSISHLTGDGRDIPPQAQLILTMERRS